MHIHLDDVPDFSGDDFANDKDIQKTRAQAKAYADMVKQCLTLIQNKLGVQESSNGSYNNFSMFKSLKPQVIRTLTTPRAERRMDVFIASYWSSIATGKVHNSGSNDYLFGYFEMQRELPNSYVCKETLKEKISELFVPMELDFEHSKSFSRRFYVLTQDKNRLTQSLQFKNLDNLATHGEMEIEIQGSRVLFRNSRRSISIEEAVAFCSLAEDLLKIFR